MTPWQRTLNGLDLNGERRATVWKAMVATATDFGYVGKTLIG